MKISFLTAKILVLILATSLCLPGTVYSLSSQTLRTQAGLESSARSGLRKSLQNLRPEVPAPISGLETPTLQTLEAELEQLIGIVVNRGQSDGSFRLNRANAAPEARRIFLAVLEANAGYRFTFPNSNGSILIRVKPADIWTLMLRHQLSFETALTTQRIAGAWKTKIGSLVGWGQTLTRIAATMGRPLSDIQTTDLLNRLLALSRPGNRESDPIFRMSSLLDTLEDIVITQSNLQGDVPRALESLEEIVREIVLKIPIPRGDNQPPSLVYRNRLDRVTKTLSFSTEAAYQVVAAIGPDSISRHDVDAPPLTDDQALIRTVVREAIQVWSFQKGPRRERPARFSSQQKGPMPTAAF
jgi:hypothetical protein